MHGTIPRRPEPRNFSPLFLSFLLSIFGFGFLLAVQGPGPKYVQKPAALIPSAPTVGRKKGPEKLRYRIT